jgi:hypothetical protein
MSQVIIDGLDQLKTHLVNQRDERVTGNTAAKHEVSGGCGNSEAKEVWAKIGYKHHKDPEGDQEDLTALIERISNQQDCPDQGKEGVRP